MNGSIFFDAVYSERQFSVKKFLRAFVAAGAMAIFLLLLMWVIEYFNPANENIILTKLNLFLVENWLFIVGFILIISVWEYLYGVFKTTKIRYLAPLLDAFGIFFALWLIAVILRGLILFVTADSPFIPVLRFLYDLVYSQPVLIFVFLILVFYSNFLLTDRNY